MPGKELYKISIQPLTGVHIGSGETITTLDYKLTDNINRNGSTIPFDTLKYIKFSSDKILKKIAKSGNQKLINEFETAITLKDFGLLRKLLHSHCTETSDIEYSCDTTPEFRKFYNLNIEKNPLNNATEIFQMYRPAESRHPYIPGTSLKGAIRTAYLNHILLEKMSDNDYDQLKNNLNNEKKNNEIQSKALSINQSTVANNAQQDPFRCIEISDCKISHEYQLVGSLNNVFFDSVTEELETKSMQIFSELIPGRLLGYSPVSEFTIRINKNLQQKKNDYFSINEKISIKEIAKSCNYFFKRQFEVEYPKFYSKPVEHVSKICELKKIIDSIGMEDTNQFLIRLGRWSQVEYVTFCKDFRRPRVPVDRRTGKEKGYGKTRILLNFDDEYIPMGWCLCTLKEIDM